MGVRRSSIIPARPIHGRAAWKPVMRLVPILENPPAGMLGKRVETARPKRPIAPAIALARSAPTPNNCKVVDRLKPPCHSALTSSPLL